MIGIQMLCIVVGVIILIVGTIAFLKIPGLMGTPLGGIGLFIWLIIMVFVLEYARLNDPWYDSIIITIVEIIGVMVTAWLMSNGVEKNLEKRFKDYRKGQRQLFSRFDKHMDDKFNAFEDKITTRLDGFEEILKSKS